MAGSLLQRNSVGRVERGETHQVRCLRERLNRIKRSRNPPQRSWLARSVVVYLLLVASPGLAENASLADGPITCTSPVAPTDSAKSLIQRYGQEAVIRDDLYTGIEDITYKGLVLLAQAADWRIEVAFTDETMGRVARLTLRDTKSSHWNVAGIAVGSGLAEVQKINGKPFLINGFEADAGGFVSNWRGGALGRPLPGGCRVVVRFGKHADAPAKLSGGDVKISSDNAELTKWAPVVEQIEVSFPDK
jgi:hypothetical protein